MPITAIRIDGDEAKEGPFLRWLGALPKRDPRARAQCDSRILDLERPGSEPHRPHADYLRDGIRELRMRVGRVQYRMLYSLLGRDVAVLTHGIVKERDAPDQEFELAIRRLDRPRANPKLHPLEFPR